ncbi:MAG: CRISPR-associated protein Cas4 [Candidatus Hadarchaeales archaeon]
MKDEQTLSAKDIMNFCYCPRIIYYEHVLKIRQATTKKELIGREKYEEFKKKSRRGKIIKEFPKLKKLYDVYLYSNKMNIGTRVDCVAINEVKKEAYPIQIKYSSRPSKIYKTQKLQLLLEAKLIEEIMGYSTPLGFIKFLKTDDLVPVNVKNRSELDTAICDIKKFIHTEVFPDPTRYKRRCVDCCYRKRCWL